MTTVDFLRALKDAKSVSFEALPAGDYDVEIVESSATRSSNGKPMIKVKFQVLSGPYQNRTVFNNFVFSADNAMAMSIFFRHMKCFGLKDEFFASLGANGSMDAVAANLMNKRARVTLGIRQWQGEDRNEVNQIKPYTGAPAMSPMPTPQTVNVPAAAPPMQVVQPVQQPQVAQPVQPQQPVQQPLQAVPYPTNETPSGLDEFRPTAVPTAQSGSSLVDASGPTPSTPATSEPQVQPQFTQPTPPQAPDLPI